MKYFYILGHSLIMVAICTLHMQVRAEIKVPSDLRLLAGSAAAELEVDRCKLQIPLLPGECAGISAQSGDAFFYAPRKGVPGKSLPYLYKPEVRTFSGAAWLYKKAGNQQEKWFGLMCSTVKGSAENSEASMNCPAEKRGGHWVADGENTGLLDSSVQEVRGENWSGIVIFSTSKVRRDARVDARFCLFGSAQIVMGHTYFDAGKSIFRQALIRKIEAIEFDD